MARRKLFSTEQWLKSPADRAIIARWSPPPSAADAVPIRQRFRVDLAPFVPPDEGWELLVLGDTGDADTAGAGLSPQDAVARALTAAAVAPVGVGQARAVIHTGDVVYMAGERRLYERNFRRPYNAFLTPESTSDEMVFRLPFFAVPGNHDYYDLGGWAQWLIRIPLLSAGLRALSHRFLGFGLPEGGSDQGGAFMQAFMAANVTQGKPAAEPLAYVPGAATRLPHRYFQATLGNVDIFALDSNTLDAPPRADPTAVQAEASARRLALERAVADLDAKIAEEKTLHARLREEARVVLTTDPTRRPGLRQAAAAVTAALGRLAEAPVPVPMAAWTEAAGKLTSDDPAELADALTELDSIGDNVCAALTALQAHLATLAAGEEERLRLTEASDAVETALEHWSATAMEETRESDSRLLALSEQALDLQRELALERRREDYHPDDHDGAQLAWFAAALEAAIADRPGNWRIVFLHHPLYTTIGNHCERSDVRGLRDNLLALLQGADRVHLVLSGHSHAFEWFRSAALPNTGVFVTGGGGQRGLRGSVFTAGGRSGARRTALRAAGIAECAVSGRGPAGSDGNTGPLHHFLRVAVQADALRVYPVGVRLCDPESTGEDRFRTEVPMPVYHLAELPSSPRSSSTLAIRPLEYIEIQRGKAPTASWRD